MEGLLDFSCVKAKYVANVVYFPYFEKPQLVEVMEMLSFCSPCCQALHPVNQPFCAEAFQQIADADAVIAPPVYPSKLPALAVRILDALTVLSVPTTDFLVVLLAIQLSYSTRTVRCAIPFMSEQGSRIAEDTGTFVARVRFLLGLWHRFQ